MTTVLGQKAAAGHEYLECLPTLQSRMATFLNAGDAKTIKRRLGSCLRSLHIVTGICHFCGGAAIIDPVICLYSTRMQLVYNSAGHVHCYCD